MSEPFADIRIPGLDFDATGRSQTAPNLRLVYFPLSAEPPQVWKDLFDAERQAPRHKVWRRAWIQFDAIVVDCIPEELEEYHLPDLKQDVASSNTKFREYLLQEAQRAALAEQEAQRDRERMKQINERLLFE